MGPPEYEKEYHTLIHAADGLYAIRYLGPYLTTKERVVSAKHTAVGPCESFEIIDVNYPPPPRPAVVDTNTLIQEAVVSKFGETLVLNGLDSGLELRPVVPLSNSSLTLTFWIYYESYERNWNRSFWFSQAEAGKEIISLHTSWGRVAWRCNGQDVCLSRGEFQLRTWHHLAVVIEDMRNSLYVDGFPQRNGSCRVTPSPTAPLCFGRSAAGEPESFCNGKIRDLLILNRALSAKEVRGLACL